MCGNVSTAKASMSVISSTCRTRVFSEYEHPTLCSGSPYMDKGGIHTHITHTYVHTIVYCNGKHIRNMTLCSSVL